MQFINKLNPKTKIIVAVSLVVILFITLAISSNKSGTEGDEYLDPGSGETVYTPSDRKPESVGRMTKDITYLGTSALLDLGMTMDQIDLYKEAVSAYSGINDYFIDEVSINKLSLKSESIAEGKYYNKITFQLTVNRQDVNDAEIYLIDLSSIDFNIKDQSGKVIYTSGDISTEDAIESKPPPGEGEE